MLGSGDLVLELDPVTGMATGRAVHSWNGSTPLGTTAADPLGRGTWGPGLRATAERRAIGGLGNGAWNIGETRYFQVLYRDPTGSCGNGFNLTNGASVTFEP